MRSKAAALTGLLATVLSASSAAHHNPGVLYDMTQTVTVQAKVTRFNPGNPHVRIYFTRVDGAGPEGAEWMAEGGSRTVLLRREWTTDLFKPGDLVTIVANPAREASNIVHMLHVVLPDGRELWAEDVPPPQAVEELLERRDAADAE